MNKPFYCLDTSFFIECWKDYYRNVFFNETSFFDLLLKKTNENHFYVHEQVHIELKKQDDRLLIWFEKNKIKFYEEKDQEKLTKINKASEEIIKNYKHLTRNKTDSADPYIIGSSKVLNGIVVSDEKEGSSYPNDPLKSKSIPLVCKHENIECLSVFDFIEKVGIKFN